MIKVLMCTYNGENFIREQLESIRNQTRMPDALLCYDDCSTDNTVRLFKEFVEEYGLDNWQIRINDVNRGWRINFRDIMHGGAVNDDDIVFFADQDDRWRPDKIAEMTDIMLSDAKILRLSSEQALIDTDGNPILNAGVRGTDSGDKRVYLENYRDNMLGMHWNNRIGCAMAVRGRLINYIIEHYGESAQFAHDMLCVFVSDAFNGGYVVDYPYIDYRIHGGNASVYDEDEANIERKIELLEKLADDMEYYYAGVKDTACAVNDAMIKEFVKNKEFIAARAELLKSNSVYKILKAKALYVSVGKDKARYADVLDVLGIKRLVSKIKKQ